MLLSQIDTIYFSQQLLDFSINVPNDIKTFINDYFFNSLQDNGENGDCILVFGSKNGLKYRVPTGISLFKARRAPFIMATGGTSSDVNLTEAEIYKQEFIKNDIPQNSIITEEFSKNTPENAMFSKKILGEMFGDKAIKVILVSNAFHMRRVLMTSMKYFPSNYSFITCPIVDTNTNVTNWHLNEKGRARIEKELRSLIVSIKNGWAVDDEFININN